MDIIVYTERPDEYEQFSLMMEKFDHNVRFLSLYECEDFTLYDETDHYFDYEDIEDRIFIIDPKLIEIDNKIMEKFNRWNSKCDYIISSPKYPLSILSQIQHNCDNRNICFNIKRTMIGSLFEYSNQIKKSDPTEELLIKTEFGSEYDRKILKPDHSKYLSDFEHKIYEVNDINGAFEIKTDIDEDDKRKEVFMNNVMKLSDILAYMMENGFLNNRSYHDGESTEEKDLFLSERNMNTLRSFTAEEFENAKGNVYNEKDVTSLYSEVDAIHDKDKEAS